MICVLRFSLTIIIVVCFAVPAISAPGLKKGEFTKWEERFNALQITVLNELAAEKEKQLTLEDRLHALQNGLSYENQRQTELEDQLAKLKEEMKDRQLACCVPPSHNIKVHGDWSTWGSWGDCTRTCGGGQRKRLRTCTNPTPTNGGRQCVDDSQDIDHCNNAACPPPELKDQQLSHNIKVHGDWSTWGSWGDCTRTCGGGQRKRLRTCTNPTPTNGGRQCVDDSQDIDHCNNAACPPPVHGDWSTWGSWGDCTRTCGAGQRKRLRTCTNPTPTNGGRQCVDDSQDIDHCNNAACPPPGRLSHARVIAGDGKGSGMHQFRGPRDVAVSPAGGRFYVADSYNSRVKIYTDDGAIIKTFGTHGQGDGQFQYPAGLAVNSHEHVIIADSMNHRIVVCDRDGQFKYTFGTHGSNTGQFNRPWGVAVDMSDNMYICDWDNNRIQMFTRTGQFIRQFGQAGSAPGELSSPMYVTVAMTTGYVYVTEYYNNRVSVFTAEGDFLFTFGTRGEANGEMMHPRGIDIDEQGFVILCDAGNDRIQVFDAEGRFISTFGSKGVNNGQFNIPQGLAIMQNGDVIVTEYYYHRIQIVSK